MPRLFRWCGTQSSAEEIKKSMDAASAEAIRKPMERDGDAYARRIEPLQRTAAEVVHQNINSLSIQHSLTLLHQLSKERPYAFMQTRQPEMNRPEHYVGIVMDLQRHVIDRLLTKHPYVDGAYKTGKQGRTTVTVQDTIRRIQQSHLMSETHLAATSTGGRLKAGLGIKADDSMHRLHFEQLVLDVAAGRAPTTEDQMEERNASRMRVR
ncbi:MAG: hypothetical protein P1U34_11150 [Coxiellaceae bacterium]|nr:hypothetical protein [Coxiellaceae bacterium]